MWKGNITKSLENLEQFTFLEVGAEKYVLTPYMISYIQDSIDKETKSKYMNIICNFYKVILFNSYVQIGLRHKEPSIPDSPDSLNNKSFGREQLLLKSSSAGIAPRKKLPLDEILMEHEKNARIHSDVEKKTMFEQLAYELRNIEYCLNYLVQLANNHTAEKYSHIKYNRGSK